MTAENFAATGGSRLFNRFDGVEAYGPLARLHTPRSSRDVQTWECGARAGVRQNVPFLKAETTRTAKRTSSAAMLHFPGAPDQPRPYHDLDDSARRSAGYRENRDLRRRLHLLRSMTRVCVPCDAKFCASMRERGDDRNGWCGPIRFITRRSTSGLRHDGDDDTCSGTSREPGR